MERGEVAKMKQAFQNDGTVDKKMWLPFLLLQDDLKYTFKQIRFQNLILVLFFKTIVYYSSTP